MRITFPLIPSLKGGDKTVPSPLVGEGWGEGDRPPRHCGEGRNDGASPNARMADTNAFVPRSH